MMKKQLFLVLSALMSSGAAAQTVDVSRYLWEEPVVRNISGADGLVQELREHIQEVLDAGHLAPLTQFYTDNMGSLGMFLYEEPGRVIRTLAAAYPYLTAVQQAQVRQYVASQFADPALAPWSADRLSRTFGARREWHPVDRVWKADTSFGVARPRVQVLYGIWLYGRNTGDWQLIQGYWPNIRNFYQARAGEADLYGTMGAHIAVARMADRFGDVATRNQAVANLQAQLNQGLNFAAIEERCWNKTPYWTSPYRREYLEARWGMIYGFVFLGLTPEIGRYLQENVAAPVAARIAQAKSRFPLWWLLQANYPNEWSGEEAIGYPAEVFGMIPPVERWALNVPAGLLESYHRSSPNGIGDCYWLESLVLAIEANGQAVWESVRGAASPAAAKQTPDGGPAGIVGNIVTAAFPDYFYIQQPDRASGIRVHQNGHSRSIGDVVEVTGTVQTNANGERYIQASFVASSGTSSAVPVYVNNGSLGGAEAGLQAGVTDGIGLNNIGLLVRTSGIIRQASLDRIIISDGSVADGVEVAGSGLIFPGILNYVSVTGISTCRREGERILPVLLARRQSDIVPHGYFGPPDTTPPSPITDLQAVASSPYSVTLSFTAPRDEGLTETVAGYDVRYSTAPVTEQNWASATPATALPPPQAPGSIQSFTVDGLLPLSVYFFAIRSYDSAGNTSGLSNVVSAQTVSDQVNNLIVNGGFETGTLSGWDVLGSMTASGQARFTGNYGVLMNGFGRIDQTFATVPGRLYYVSARIRLDEQLQPPAWGGLTLGITDYGSWQNLGSSQFISAENTAPGVWTRIDFTFTAIASQSRIQFQNFSGGGQFRASADNIFVSESPIP